MNYFSQAVAGDCGFLAANLYARSIFGEDALANLSIEKPYDKPDSPVIGHVRIRAKSQVSVGLQGEQGLFKQALFATPDPPPPVFP